MYSMLQAKTSKSKVAKEKNFDYFTTTLTVSPCQNSKTINLIGLNIEKRKYKIFSVRF